MALNRNQQQTLRTYIDASVDANVIAWRTQATRDDGSLFTWLQGFTTVSVWNEAVDARTLYEAMTVSKFDNITAGKRDAWKITLDFAPVDFTRAKRRNDLVDIWGAVDSVPILQASTRFAKRYEEAFGGTDVTTNTVTAKKLNYSGSLSLDDVSNALNLVV